MSFEQFFTPKECEKILERRKDLDSGQHDWFWAIVTEKTKISNPEIEAVLTTKEAIDKHAKQFADMKIVPAYQRNPHNGEELHPVYK